MSETRAIVEVGGQDSEIVELIGGLKPYYPFKVRGVFNAEQTQFSEFSGDGKNCPFWRRYKGILILIGSDSSNHPCEHT